jgi:hypothetical protein
MLAVPMLPLLEFEQSWTANILGKGCSAHRRRFYGSSWRFAPQGTGLSKLTQQDLDLGDMTTSEKLAKTFR